MQHTRTETALKGIETTLKTIKAEKDRTTEELKKVNSLDSDVYVEGYKEKKRAEINNNFEAFSLKHSGALEAFATTVIEAEQELQAAAIDVNDTTLSNALALVNSMGDSLPVDQQRDIAKQFSGNYAAEKCLQALYSKLGLSYVIQVTNGEALTRELYRAVIAFNHDKDKPASSFNAIERAANKMLEAFNSSYKIDIGVSEAAMFERVCAAAGLTMTI